MSDRPRRRSAQRPRAPKPKYSLFLTFLGVTIAGFVIGAAFAFYQRSHVDAPAPLPVASPTLPPAMDASPSPEVESPVAASPSRSPSASSSASASPSATPSSTPTPAVSPSTSPAAAVSSAAAGSPSSQTSSAPGAGAAPHVTPLPSAAPSAAAPAAPAGANDAADSDFARLAAVVVRQYIAAIERGDMAAAYAAFGAAPGTPGITLTEQKYVEPGTRIVRVSSSGTDDAATVNVDLETAGTTYFAQYFLTRTASGAAVIQRHSIVKP